MVDLENILKPAIITKDTSKNFGKRVIIEGIGKHENKEYTYIISNTISGLETTDGDISRESIHVEPDWLTIC